MRIAIVIERLETWRGGAETSTQELARLLIARGHEVHLVTSTNAQSRPDMPIHLVSTSSVLGPLRTAAFVKNAEAFLSGQRFDIVHAIAPMPGADVYQPRGGLLREIVERNVAMRRSASRRLLKRALMAMNVKQRSQLELERRIFRAGGPVIAAVSQYVAAQCERLYGAAPPRVRVVFNGVNVAKIEEEAGGADRSTIRDQYRLSPDTLVLLFMAHNFRLKGLYPLLDALALLRSDGFHAFHLLVVGRDNPAPYQRRLDLLGLKGRVTFTGPTQRSALFFRAADMVVHPTYYDPCSRVILEAIAHGLPSITTSFNGAAEVITDGVEGFVIESPGRIEPWSRRIRELGDPALRRNMSGSALRLRGRIDMARHAAELERLFDDIRADRSRSSPPAFSA